MGYQEQKQINGILHHRETPQAEWIPYTAQELTAMVEKSNKNYVDMLSKRNQQIKKQKDEIADYKRRLKSMANYDSGRN